MRSNYKLGHLPRILGMLIFSISECISGIANYTLSLSNHACTTQIMLYN